MATLAGVEVIEGKPKNFATISEISGRSMTELWEVYEWDERINHRRFYFLKTPKE